MIFALFFPLGFRGFITLKSFTSATLKEMFRIHLIFSSTCIWQSKIFKFYSNIYQRTTTFIRQTHPGVQLLLQSRGSHQHGVRDVAWTLGSFSTFHLSFLLWLRNSIPTGNPRIWQSFQIWGRSCKPPHSWDLNQNYSDPARPFWVFRSPKCLLAPVNLLKRLPSHNFDADIAVLNYRDIKKFVFKKMY